MPMMTNSCCWTLTMPSILFVFLLVTTGTARSMSTGGDEADEDDASSSPEFRDGPVIRQPEQRWIKPSPKAIRLGDSCSSDLDCSIVTHSYCDPDKGVCTCPKDYPVDGGSLCGQGRVLNESCSFHAECVESDRNLQCRDSICQCIAGYFPAAYTGGNIVCTSTTKPDGVGSFVDPTMIGVLIGLILMFIIMCVVLRLFSKARWRENRTIFNTPNPRLANASLLNKEALAATGKGQPGGSRRGSMSVRNGSSRQESLASIPRSLNDASASTSHSIPRHVSAGTSTAEDARRDAGESDKLLSPPHHSHHHHHHQVSVQVDQSVV